MLTKLTFKEDNESQDDEIIPNTPDQELIPAKSPELPSLKQLKNSSPIRPHYQQSIQTPIIDSSQPGFNSSFYNSDDDINNNNNSNNNNNENNNDISFESCPTSPYYDDIGPKKLSLSSGYFLFFYFYLLIYFYI